MGEEPKRKKKRENESMEEASSAPPLKLVLKFNRQSLEKQKPKKWSLKDIVSSNERKDIVPATITPTFTSTSTSSNATGLKIKLVTKALSSQTQDNVNRLNSQKTDDEESRKNSGGHNRQKSAIDADLLSSSDAKENKSFLKQKLQKIKIISKYNTNSDGLSSNGIQTSIPSDMCSPSSSISKATIEEKTKKKKKNKKEKSRKRDWEDTSKEESPNEPVDTTEREEFVEEDEWDIKNSDEENGLRKERVHDENQKKIPNNASAEKNIDKHHSHHHRHHRHRHHDHKENDNENDNDNSSSNNNNNNNNINGHHKHHKHHKHSHGTESASESQASMSIPFQKSRPNVFIPLKKALRNVLVHLIKKDKHGFFYDPVTEEVAPDYFIIVKCPMDFATMKKKLNEGFYKDFKSFEDDFKLICDNCMIYNSSETLYFKEAKRLFKVGSEILQSYKVKVDPALLYPRSSPSSSSLPSNSASNAALSNEKRSPLLSGDDIFIDRAGRLLRRPRNKWTLNEDGELSLVTSRDPSANSPTSMASQSSSPFVGPLSGRSERSVYSSPHSLRDRSHDIHPDTFLRTRSVPSNFNGNPSISNGNNNDSSNSNSNSNNNNNNNSNPSSSNILYSNRNNYHNTSAAGIAISNSNSVGVGVGAGIGIGIGGSESHSSTGSRIISHYSPYLAKSADTLEPSTKEQLGQPYVPYGNYVSNYLNYRFPSPCPASSASAVMPLDSSGPTLKNVNSLEGLVNASDQETLEFVSRFVSNLKQNTAFQETFDSHSRTSSSFSPDAIPKETEGGNDHVIPLSSDLGNFFADTLFSSKSPESLSSRWSPEMGPHPNVQVPSVKLSREEWEALLKDGLDVNLFQSDSKETSSQEGPSSTIGPCRPNDRLEYNFDLGHFQEQLDLNFQMLSALQLSQCERSLPTPSENELRLASRLVQNLSGLAGYVSPALLASSKRDLSYLKDCQKSILNL